MEIYQGKILLVHCFRYRIVQKISFGSYGSIYSAVDVHTNKDVAVKFEIGNIISSSKNSYAKIVSNLCHIAFVFRF